MKGSIANMFKFSTLVDNLPTSVPFVGPETQERLLSSVFKARIGANENVFGPSPLAVKAMKKASQSLWMYGDPENYDLKNALADHHRINSQNIVIGEGIDGLLGYITRMFIEPGDSVVTSDGAYPTFNFHVTGYGGKLHKVPYKNDLEDPEALIERAKEVKAKLIYLANPDNPMGTVHSGSVISKLINSVPDGCLLILDEAYIEFADDNTKPKLNPSSSKVIRMRTFSKGYGLAGARVGYGIGHPNLIKAFDKVRNHFGMNRVSQIGALAALSDKAHLETTRELVKMSRDEITRIAVINGLKPISSAANFVCVDCKADGEFARKILNELINHGIFVRMPFVAPQNRAIRISCGTDKDLKLLEKILPKVLRAVSTS